MKRGTITIRNANSKSIQVSIELSEDGTVWMTKNEIASLFNVYHSSVAANLKSLFKSGGLLENEVKKECPQTLENGQKCIVEYFNLEVILALCYRMDSPICTLFRQWVAKQVSVSFKKHSQIIVHLGTATTMN
jgi:hypothetical protein